MCKLWIYKGCPRCRGDLRLTNELDGWCYKCVTGCMREWPLSLAAPNVVEEVGEGEGKEG